MSNAVNREGQKLYPLRNVGREDYTSSWLRGTPASRRVADVQEVDWEESSTDMDQLVFALMELTMFQKGAATSNRGDPEVTGGAPSGGGAAKAAAGRTAPGANSSDALATCGTDGSYEGVPKG